MARRAFMLRWLVALAIAGCGTVGQVARDAPLPTPGEARRPIGLVLLHGKWGGMALDPLNVLASRLRDDGYAVATPEMPWSNRRAYDAGWEQAMEEIGQAVRAVRERGWRRVVLGGYSMGANAALRYATTRGDVEGLMMIAPGHVPESFARSGPIRQSLAEAQRMVEAGQGDRAASFEDTNQGQRRTLQVRAADYVSYFDPEGAAVMPRNAEQLRRPLPFLWLIGRDDTLSREGEAYVFARVAPHPKSRYVVVAGGHFATGLEGLMPIRAWLEELAGPS